MRRLCAKGPPAWLEKAIFYQIYPQSFLDANGDGIGDLNGITQKLDYLQSMGFNALWLNPCFVSPFQDAGYDVADYYRIAPRYGTNSDARRLFSEAQKRGIRVCLDLVPGHTSLEHPWFLQSARTQRNAYSDRYIWVDGTGGLTEQGLNLIRGFAERPVGYVSNYYYSQPALNYGFAHPDPAKPWQLAVNDPGPKATASEMLKVMNYWMDLGASGFRVDMAGSLVKGDPGQAATIRLWSPLSAARRKKHPDAVLISEWSDPERAIKAGFDADFLIHFGPHAHAYNSLFRLGKNSFFHPSGKGDARPFLSVYQSLLRRSKSRGYVSVPSGNHDFSRLSVGRDFRELKVCFAFLLTLPGLPFIYYGDEIGMAYHPDLPSKEGGYERTGCRTPMQWNRKKNKGFSNAPSSKLYLPVDANPRAPDVASQWGKPDSLLETVRALNLIRRTHPALQAKGSFKVLSHGRSPRPLVYTREKEGEKILVAVQPSAGRSRLNLRLKANSLLLLAKGMELTAQGVLKAQGFSYGIFRLK